MITININLTLTCNEEVVLASWAITTALEKKHTEVKSECEDFTKAQFVEENVDYNKKRESANAHRKLIAQGLIEPVIKKLQTFETVKEATKQCVICEEYFIDKSRNKKRKTCSPEHGHQLHKEYQRNYWLTYKKNVCKPSEEKPKEVKPKPEEKPQEFVEIKPKKATYRKPRQESKELILTEPIKNKSPRILKTGERICANKCCKKIFKAKKLDDRCCSGECEVIVKNEKSRKFQMA